MANSRATIAFDVSYIQKRATGYGRLASVLLRGLLDADTERTYLLYGWSNSLDKDAIRSFAKENVRFSISRIPGPMKRSYWNTLRLPALGSIIGEFDIFHSSEPLLPPLGKSKGIITVHDVAYKKFPQWFTPEVLGWDKAIQRSIKEASAVIVPSENTSRDLLEFFDVPATKVRVVRPPVNPAFLRADSTKHSGRRYILFVGTIEPRKNIPGLVKAFEKIRDKELSLVIAGKRGWKSEESMQAIERSPLRNRIELRDFITDDELARLYREAEMLVYPSFYEGHGSPVMEAMASGTPAITSNNSSLREIAEGVAVLIDPNRPEEIAAAIDRVSGDSALREELSAKGRERASKFSAADAAQVVLRLYSELEPS